GAGAERLQPISKLLIAHEPSVMSLAQGHVVVPECGSSRIGLWWSRLNEPPKAKELLAETDRDQSVEGLSEMCEARDGHPRVHRLPHLVPPDQDQNRIGLPTNRPGCVRAPFEASSPTA